MSFGNTAKKAGKRALKATSWLATEMWNGSRTERIEAIDEEIKTLQEERTRLVDELITEDDS